MMKKLMVMIAMCSVLVLTIVGISQAQDEHKFFDKTNVILLTMSTATMIGDLTNTEMMVHTGRYHEVDPLWANLINHHGAAGAVVSCVASETITVGLTYLAHKTGHHK
ncbi:MAG: hypothetical protein ACHP6H_07545, partial [Legionellales bacterium]